MVSNRIKAGIAGALAAATLQVLPAGEAQAEPSLGGQQQANVVNLVQTQTACAPCDTPHVVQKGFEPQPTTDVDFLESKLADAFQLQSKNVVVIISDRSFQQNKAFIDQVANLAQRFYQTNGIKIDYVIQVYSNTKKPRSFPLDGTMRLYVGGAVVELNPLTKAPLRSLEDIALVLKNSEKQLKEKKMASSSDSGKGEGRASSDIAPPDLMA